MARRVADFHTVLYWQIFDSPPAASYLWDRRVWSVAGVLTCDEEAVHQVGAELTPLGHGPRHDGGGRGSKHILEEPAGEQRLGLVGRHPVPGAQEDVPLAVRKRPPDYPVGNGAQNCPIMKTTNTWASGSHIDNDDDYDDDDDDDDDNDDDDDTPTFQTVPIFTPTFSAITQNH